MMWIGKPERVLTAAQSEAFDKALSCLADVSTADNPIVRACTDGGVGHDWRPHTYQQLNEVHTSWRCVWCHAVACGDYDEADPCMEPYHHRGVHRSRIGLVWPLGGNRP